MQLNYTQRPRQQELFYLGVRYHDTIDNYYYDGNMGEFGLYTGAKFGNTLSEITLEERLSVYK